MPREEKVQVYVRVRPHDRPALKCTGTTISTNTPPKKKFTFDNVMYDTSQDDVFRTVQPMLEDALNDCHGTIMAYGQTGSGKTFTMTGTKKHPGIVPRALAYAFARPGIKLVTMKYVEIYNDRPFDLLNKNKELKIFNFEVHQAKEVVVSENFWPLLERISACRTTASTTQNERSSRSHAIMMLRIEREGGVSGHTGLWTFVDLAGSERPQDRGFETKAINTSVSHLVSVMDNLSKGQPAAFRTCKLTQLLRDSFTSNKCVLLACVRAEEKYLGETRHTLDKAHCAKRIKNKVVRKTKKQSRLQVANAKLKQLAKELDEAREAKEAAEQRGGKAFEAVYQSMKEEPRNTTLHKRLVIEAMGLEETVIDPSIDAFYKASFDITKSLLSAQDDSPA